MSMRSVHLHVDVNTHSRLNSVVDIVTKSGLVMNCDSSVTQVDNIICCLLE